MLIFNSKCSTSGLDLNKLVKVRTYLQKYKNNILNYLTSRVIALLMTKKYTCAISLGLIRSQFFLRLRKCQMKIKQDSHSMSFEIRLYVEKNLKYS
jgi:hypothetical protein